MSGQSGERRLAGNMMYSLMASVVQNAGLFVVTLLIARYFGIEDQGRYAYALGIATLVKQCLELSLPLANTKLLAERDQSRTGRFSSFLVLSFFLSLAGTFILMLISYLNSSELLFFFWSWFLGFTLFSAVFSSCNGLQRMAASFWFTLLLYTSITGFLVFSRVLSLDFTATVKYMNLVFLVSCIFIFGAGLSYLRRHGVTLRLRQVLMPLIKRYYSLGFWLYMPVGAVFALQSIIVLFLKSAGGFRDVGLFTVCASLSQLSAVVLSAMSLAFMPYISKSFSEGRHGQQGEVVRYYQKALSVISLLFLAGIVTLREPLLSMYGKDYLQGSQLLLILSAASFCDFTRFLSAPLLGGTEHARISAAVEALKSIFIAGLSVVLYRQWGVAGVGYAYLSVQLLTSIFRLYFLDKKLGYRLYKENAAALLIMAAFLVIVRLSPLAGIALVLVLAVAFRIFKFSDARRILIALRGVG